MRALVPNMVSALGLAGCGGEEQANNTVNVDQAVMSNDLAANDVTAIDAVTADAADMAADVDINFTNEMPADSATNGARAETPRSRPATAAPRPRPQEVAPAPAAEPATANAATNSNE